MNKRIIHILGQDFYCEGNYSEEEYQGNKKYKGQFKIYSISCGQPYKLIYDSDFNCIINRFTSEEVIDLFINKYGYTIIINYIFSGRK